MTHPAELPPYFQPQELSNIGQNTDPRRSFPVQTALLSITLQLDEWADWALIFDEGTATRDFFYSNVPLI